MNKKITQEPKDHHIPVLLNEIITFLTTTYSSTVPLTIFDGTLGLGGHTSALLQTFPHSQLITTDLDPQNIKIASTRLKDYLNNKRLKIIPTNFTQALENLTSELDIILLDLGLSSPHIDNPQRGFSFTPNSPLDMRFNPNQTLTAAAIINTYPPHLLHEIFIHNSDLHSIKSLVQLIIYHRNIHPITTSTQLNAIITQKFSPQILPQIYQTLRITVNDELNTITTALPHSLSALKPHGSLLIISYHSLEDRLVKQFMKNQTKNPARVQLITKKPLTPTSQEIYHNPRSRSAKMRIITKL